MLPIPLIQFCRVVRRCRESVQRIQLEMLTSIAPDLWPRNISDTKPTDTETYAQGTVTVPNDYETALHWHMETYHKRTLTEMMIKWECSYLCTRRRKTLFWTVLN